MSQEEIDALVGADPDPLETAEASPAPEESAPDAPEESTPDPAPAAAGPAPAPVPESEPAAPTPTLVVQAAPAPTPTSTNALIVSAGSSGESDAAQRLASLEVRMTALQQSAGDGQDDAAIQALNQQVQALHQQLQALSAQMNQLAQHLQNSLGFGLRTTYQCGVCSAQGLVGSRVSCMHCGTESWIGWSA